MSQITLNVNGTVHRVDVEPSTPLLYILRNDIGLHAPQFGCGLGQGGLENQHVQGALDEPALLAGGVHWPSLDKLEKSIQLTPLDRQEEQRGPTHGNLQRRECRPATPVALSRRGMLATLWTDDPKHDVHEEGVSYPAFNDWRTLSRSFQDLAFFSRANPVTLTSVYEPEPVESAVVSANFFSVLGVRPELGRDFSSDDVQRRDRVVVLSHALWQRRFDEILLLRDRLKTRQRCCSTT